MSTEGRQIKVKFKAEYRSDGGFRVYAVEPTGLYVSSKSTYAAAEYFQNLSPCVVVYDERTKEGDGVALLTSFDWQKIAAEGIGECEFEVVTGEEIEAESDDPGRILSGAEDFPTPAGQTPELAEIELHVVARKIGGKTIMVVTDPGDPDPVLEQLITQFERVQ